MHAKLFNSLTPMNGKGVNWRSERTALLARLVGSLEAVADSLVLVAASAAALAAVASEAAEGSQVATAEVVEALEVVLGAVIVEHLPQEWAIVAMLQYLPTTSRTMLRVEGSAAPLSTSAM